MINNTCQICSNTIKPFYECVYDDRYGYPKTYSILKCESCGHAIVVPELTSNEISTLYTEYYPRNEMSVEMNTKAIIASKTKIFLESITMSQVLEHMVNPVETIKGVHDILKPNGHLIFSLPNSQSIMAKFLKQKWINWHIPYHQQHFTKDSTITLAQECGFEIESIKIIAPVHWLIYQINHLMFYPKQGKPSVFWSYSEKKALYLKIIFGITGLMDRLSLMMPIARLLDLFKIGESYVAVFRRS